MILSSTLTTSVVTLRPGKVIALLQLTLHTFGTLALYSKSVTLASKMGAALLVKFFQNKRQ